jgi:hypothetical protein
MSPASGLFLKRFASVSLLGCALAACASSTPAPVVYARPAGGVPAAAVHARPAPVVSGAPFDTATAPRILEGPPPSECVPFARAASGVVIYGDAVTWWDKAAGKYPRSGEPAAGSVLVLRGYNDDTRGHVAVVAEIVSPRMVRVDHANWMRKGEISVAVPVADVSPNNDWSMVRVWHIPGGDWGARTYAAQGFIHPVSLASLK